MARPQKIPAGQSQEEHSHCICEIQPDKGKIQSQQSQMHSYVAPDVPREQPKLAQLGHQGHSTESQQEQQQQSLHALCGECSTAPSLTGSDPMNSSSKTKPILVSTSI